MSVLKDETAIERVERRLDELSQIVNRRRDEVTARMDAFHGSLQEDIEELQSRLGAFSDEQKRLRRHELRLQVLGSRLFILGAALSAAANLVA